MRAAKRFDRWLELALAICVGLTLACCEKESPGGTQQVAAPQLEALLEGRFRKVTKQASGIAQIRRNGETYELVLRGVETNASPPIHVYIVGLDEATSTAAVDSTEMKYDMGPLQLGGEQQVIPLPAKPLDELKTVVLWNPKFGINLAAASLSAAQ